MKNRKAARSELYQNRTYKEFQKAIADNLRRVREARELTQEEASHLCRMAVRQYQSTEAGRTNLSLLTLARLVEGLGISAAELLSFKGKPESGGKAC